jgi:S1-C subfamily serine protease
VNVVDLVIVVALVAAVAYGVRVGLLAGLASLVGLAVGGVLGVVAASFAADHAAEPLVRGTAVLVLVAGGALVGAMVGSAVGARLSRGAWHEGRVPRLIDALGGAVLGAASVLMVAWVMTSALLVPAVPAMAPVVGSSHLMSTAEGLLPGFVRSTIQSWGDRLVSETLPQVFGDVLAPPVVPAATPTPSEVEPAAEQDAAQLARASVVQINGTATACGVTVSGSGIPYAPERVMTAAHVVAGVDAPRVRHDGRSWPATVVAIDTALDVAVLAVPDLDVPTMTFDPDVAAPGERSLVVGYPGGGDITVLPASVMRAFELVGPGWDGTPDVGRDVYQVLAPVVSGYSGGPLVSEDGDVLGLVFASSKYQAGTGFAMTARAVADYASQGESATEAVATGSCQVPGT